MINKNKKNEISESLPLGTVILTKNSYQTLLLYIYDKNPNTFYTFSELAEKMLEIDDGKYYPEPSISAALRSCRKIGRFVNKRIRRGHSRLYEYNVSKTELDSPKNGDYDLYYDEIYRRLFGNG